MMHICTSLPTYHGWDQNDTIGMLFAGSKQAGEMSIGLPQLDGQFIGKKEAIHRLVSLLTSCLPSKEGMRE